MPDILLLYSSRQQPSDHRFLQQQCSQRMDIFLPAQTGTSEKIEHKWNNAGRKTILGKPSSHCLPFAACSKQLLGGVVLKRHCHGRGRRRRRRRHQCLSSVRPLAASHCRQCVPVHRRLHSRHL